MVGTLTFRELPKEEWHKLLPIFLKNGSEPPAADFSKIVVAEDEGKIVGMHCLSLSARIGPMWLDEDYRGQHIWEDMFERLESYMAGLNQPYFMFTRDDRTEYMAKKFGLRPLDWKVWIKER